MPHQLRQLFSLICLNGLPKNALEMFERFLPDLAEDYLHRQHPPEVARALALDCIHESLLSGGKALSDFGLPAPDAEALRRGLQHPDRQEGGGRLLPDH